MFPLELVRDSKVAPGVNMLMSLCAEDSLGFERWKEQLLVLTAFVSQLVTHSLLHSTNTY